MSPTALRRAVGLSVTLIALSLGLGYARVGGTFAIWDGETTNKDSAFAAGWVGPPTGLGTPTASGYGASLAWTPGTHGPVTGQQLSSVDGGTGARARCGTYAVAATMASASTSTYTATGTIGANGHWWCYKMVSTSATAWTASATFTPVRVGLIPTAVSITNGDGALGKSDTVTITFNQQPAAPTSPMVVCAFGGSGTVVLGDTHAGGCSATSDTSSLGTIAGMSLATGTLTFGSSTVTRSGNTYVITLKGTNSTLASGTGTATYTASTSIASSAGSAQACTTNNCLVIATGGF